VRRSGGIVFFLDCVVVGSIFAVAAVYGRVNTCSCVRCDFGSTYNTGTASPVPH